MLNRVAVHWYGCCTDWKQEHGANDNSEKCLFCNPNSHRAWDCAAAIAAQQAAPAASADGVHPVLGQSPSQDRTNTPLGQQGEGGHITFQEPIATGNVLSAETQHPQSSVPSTTTAPSVTSAFQTIFQGMQSSVTGSSDSAICCLYILRWLQCVNDNTNSDVFHQICVMDTKDQQAVAFLTKEFLPVLPLVLPPITPCGSEGSYIEMWSHHWHQYINHCLYADVFGQNCIYFPSYFDNVIGTLNDTLPKVGTITPMNSLHLHAETQALVAEVYNDVVYDVDKPVSTTTVDDIIQWHSFVILDESAALIFDTGASKGITFDAFNFIEPI
eukprot:4406468-Ditylum_brightwellii.AAC.2